MCLQADSADLLEKMNSYCECMNGAAGQVAGWVSSGASCCLRVTALLQDALL